MASGADTAAAWVFNAHLVIAGDGAHRHAVAARQPLVGDPVDAVVLHHPPEPF